MDIPSRVQTRTLSHARRNDAGCLVSLYSTGSHGYAQVGWVTDGRQTMTLCHRVAWYARHGAIPPGMTVDHLCKNRRCVDVEHLRLITNLDNARRTAGRDWPLGECVNGHSDAMYWRQPASGGKGYCAACRAERQQRKRGTVRRKAY